MICVLLLVFGVALTAQEPASAPTPALAAPGASAPASAATLRGRITDPSGALLPGAKITIANAAGLPVATAVADSAGAYVAANLAPGSYVVEANFEGFAPFFSPTVALAAGQIKRVDIAMALQVEQQNVVVTDESPTVNVEASGNANAIVLKGKDLDALSDDPDELSNELTALAGPSAGPNGGQIYIDGFSGGQLPPKSAIREIRINQNPFSAEFDKLGYGRIEILTKPGTDKLHGQGFIQGSDKAFNTGNPFTSTVPAYYSYQFNGTVSGAISKSASFFFSGERRNIQSDNTWSIPLAVLPDANGDGGYTEIPNFGVSVFSPHIRNNLSARLDWQLGQKNTFTVRYGFWSENEQGNLSPGSLPSTTVHESNSDNTVQASDAIILNDHAVNETRFQFERHDENHYPDSTDESVNVTGDFSGGGFSGQKSLDHTLSLELWNITTVSHGGQAIKFGTRVRDTRDARLTDSNFKGSFTFASPSAYLAMGNGLAGTGAGGHQSFSSLVAAGDGPTSASYSSGNQHTLANVFDAALFFQDDWKVNPRLTLSGGLRWETQNHVADHNDWAPRVSLAYALDGNGKDKKTKTVWRAGYGLFYDRLGVNNLLTINTAQLQPKVVLNKPDCASASPSDLCNTATKLSDIALNTLVSSLSASPVRYEVDPTYHSPYTGQAGTSLERQLLRGTSATLTYLHSFGVHQMNTRNANQAFGGKPQDANGAYLYEYFPEAVFKEDQLILSANATLSKKLSLNANYTTAWANANTGSASNAYNLTQDYGRAGFVSRNMIFAMASYTGPWGIRFNPFLIAQSGKPFNITLNTDPYNNLFNQRPSYVTSATPATDPVIATSLGNFDVADPSSELNTPRIPVNLGNGPAAVAVNLRVSKAFGIGPKTQSAGGSQDGGGPPGGGPPPGGDGGGRRGGPPGGGLGPGGLGGGGGGPRGMGGGSANTGHKYSLNLSAQALNLFNDIDYGTPNGTLGSPSFNRSTNLAGSIFSTGSAARRIFFQAVFSF